MNFNCLCLSPLALMFSNWWKDWKWNWVFTLESNPVFPLRQKRGLLQRLFCLYWTTVMLYIHASSQCLHALDTVYHGALRFKTNLKIVTHHCVLYARVGWSALSIRRQKHWHVFIYKSILGLLPSYLYTYICKKYVCSYSLQSRNYSYCLSSGTHWLGEKGI